MFEAIHGSAPRMMEEGRGEYANPSSLIKASELLLRHIGMIEAADRLAAAMAACDKEKAVVITNHKDGATCKEFADYVISKL